VYVLKRFEGDKPFEIAPKIDLEKAKKDLKDLTYDVA